jgi:hypothetical protein
MIAEIAYSPKQGLLIGVVGCVLFGFIILRALRTGTIPRGRPPIGKLPPEMGTVISRDKEPRAFWRNIWIGVAIIGIGVAVIVLNLISMFDPDF